MMNAQTSNIEERQKRGERMRVEVSDSKQPATNQQKIGKFSGLANYCILHLHEFDGNQLKFSLKIEEIQKECS